MFDFLCYKPADSYLPKPGPVSHIRVINAAPDAKRVDVLSNGHLIVNKLGYKKFTPYFPVPSGQHNIRAYGPGANVNCSIEMLLDTNLIYTLAVIGRQDVSELFIIHDIKPENAEGCCSVRFINLSDYNTLDLLKPGGSIVFSNVGYKEITEYAHLTPGKYNLTVSESSSKNTVLTISNADFKADWNYTIFIMGIKNSKKGLHAAVLLDGSTYIHQ